MHGCECCAHEECRGTEDQGIKCGHTSGQTRGMRSYIITDDLNDTSTMKKDTTAAPHCPDPVVRLFRSDGRRRVRKGCARAQVSQVRWSSGCDRALGAKAMYGLRAARGDAGRQTGCDGDGAVETEGGASFFIASFGRKRTRKFLSDPNEFLIFASRERCSVCHVTSGTKNGAPEPRVEYARL